MLLNLWGRGGLLFLHSVFCLFNLIINLCLYINQPQWCKWCWCWWSWHLAEQLEVLIIISIYLYFSINQALICQAAPSWTRWPLDLVSCSGGNTPADWRSRNRPISSWSMAALRSSDSADSSMCSQRESNRRHMFPSFLPPLRNLSDEISIWWIIVVREETNVYPATLLWGAYVQACFVITAQF